MVDESEATNGPQVSGRGCARPGSFPDFYVGLSAGFKAVTEIPLTVTERGARTGRWIHGSDYVGPICRLRQ